MRRRMTRLALAVALGAGLAPPAKAAKVAIEMPAAELPASDALRAELEEVKKKLSPHSVLWLASGAVVPSGYWGLTGWSLTDSADELQLKACFTRPQSMGNPPKKWVATCPGPTGDPPEKKVATCPGRIAADGTLARNLIENCIHDLLNQTFFDPDEGFVGYVKAPVCKFVKDFDYQFRDLRLAAKGIEPGLSIMSTREWPTMLLAMESPLGPDKPFLFRDATAGYAGPFASLRTLDAEDIQMTVLYLYTAQSTDSLQHAACSGVPVEHRILRFYLEQTPVPPILFPSQDRTSPSGGGR